MSDIEETAKIIFDRIKPEFDKQIQDAVKKEQENCICKGNLRAIVKESEHLLNKRFIDDKGQEFYFFGIVIGDDDYYYGMGGFAGTEYRLVSCVAFLEKWGYVLCEE